MGNSRSTSRTVSGEADVSAAAYVNYCEVTADLSKAEFMLGQALHDSDRVLVKGRFVTSPTHLHRFSEILAGACRAYDDRFGAPPAGDGDVSGKPEGEA